MTVAENRKGRVEIWCEQCKRYIWVDDDEHIPELCPMCDSELLTMRCNRCGHTWKPRGSVPKVMPGTCPNCKSPYWNRERLRQKDGDADGKDIER